SEVACRAVALCEGWEESLTVSVSYEAIAARCIRVRHSRNIDSRSGIQRLWQRPVKQFAATRRMGRYQVGRSHDQSIRRLSRAQGQSPGRAGHPGDLWPNGLAAQSV